MIKLIDTHCHILPGLDDGSQTLEQALQMAEIAIKNGIETIIVTPHHANGAYDNPAFAVRESLSALQEELAGRNMPLRLLPGQEIRIHAGLLDEWDQGQLLCLNQSEYILLEMPHSHIPDSIYDLLYELRIKNLHPVIAHPERNAEIIAEPDRARQLAEHGALLQLTAGSVIGMHGRTIRRLALSLCRQGIVHLLGSDAHNSARCISALAEAYRVLEDQLGSSYAEYYADNANRLVSGTSIVPRDSPRQSKRWYQFWHH